jgi:predicted nucleic acid-binding protein
VARVFFDTNLFIYLFEGHPKFEPEVRRIRTRMIERGDALLTSALTVGEILARPIAKGDHERVRSYRELFQSGVVTVLPFGIEAGFLYGQLRSAGSISAADAMQLACAGAAGADLFITNDDLLSRRTVPGIHFVTNLQRCPL